MVNRGFCLPVGFKYELKCSCFRRVVQDSVLDSLVGKREGCLRAGSIQRRSVLPNPAPLAAPLCAAPTRPARGVSGFWSRQVVFIRGFCSSIGFNRIWLVRASGETFRRRVFDALGGTRKDCILGGQFCWHTVLPDPAPPHRRAPRRDPPVVCPGFGLGRFRRHVSPSNQKHEQAKFYVNRWRPRDEKRSFLWLLTSGPTPFCLCKPFSCKACSGTDRETKSAVDPRVIRDLSPGRKALFVLGCLPVYRRLFVSVNPFHATVRESSARSSCRHPSP